MLLLSNVRILMSDQFSSAQLYRTTVIIIDQAYYVLGLERVTIFYLNFILELESLVDQCKTALSTVEPAPDYSPKKKQDQVDFAKLINQGAHMYTHTQI